jgi:hypothetical protein
MAFGGDLSTAKSWIQFCAVGWCAVHSADGAGDVRGLLCPRDALTKDRPP